MLERTIPRSLAVGAVIVALLVGCSPNPAPSGGGNPQAGTGDIQAIIAVLTSDASTQARVDAATTLGKLGAAGGPESPAAAEAVDHLAVALKDKESAVRAAAAGGLGRLGLEPGVEPLLGALDDEAAEVRDAAEEGLDRLLGDLDDQVASAVLVDALDHRSATVRAAAAKGLGDVGQASALLPVLRCLDDTAGPVKDAASASYKVLAKRLPAAAVATVLAGALGTETTTVRAAAAAGLGDVGQASDAVTLLGLLGDTSAAVRDAATAGLAALLPRLTETSAVSVLLDATKGSDAAVRKAADTTLRKYLASLGVEKAVSAVIAAEASDTWLAVALGVSPSRVSAETRRLGIQLEPLDDIAAAAAPARSGGRVPGAHRYAASGAFHPAVVFAADLAGSSTDAWAPTALRFLELVVTEKVTWQKIQVCKYYGPDITRYRAVVTIKLISAATGKVISQKTYTGSAPRKCRQTEPYSLTVLKGSMPGLSPAIRWLRSLIHAPA